MLGLIEEALNKAEQQAAESNPGPEEQPSEEAGVGPCEAPQDGGDPQPSEEGDPALLDEEKPA